MVTKTESHPKGHARRRRDIARALGLDDASEPLAYRALHDTMGEAGIEAFTLPSTTDRKAPPLIDENGEIARPRFRAVTVVRAMHRKGLIDDAQLASAERFEVEFKHSALDPLRAFDPTPRFKSRMDPAEVGLDAKRAVGRAMVAVGGHGSDRGWVLWWIVGAGYDRAEFNRRRLGSQRPPMSWHVLNRVMHEALGDLVKLHRDDRAWRRIRAIRVQESLS